MLEIIALVLLCSLNGKLAIKKGLKKNTWWLYTVLAWLGAEIVGVIIGVLIFGGDNLLALMMVGLAGGVGGYLIVRAILEKKPDQIDDDISRIGVDDLKP